MTKKKRGIAGINFILQDIQPLTPGQVLTFNSKKHLVLHGSAGSGKTFSSLYLALSAINDSTYNKLVLIRSAVPTRDIGFLPGNEQEKIKVYEEPYYNIVNELFLRDDAYDILKTKGIIDFMTTSYIRGITLDDCVIIVDECQNMSFHELDSVITRVGDNCRIIFCGDFMQSDLKNAEKNGIKNFLDILTTMDQFDNIEFGIEDIVRSAFVKDYIIAKQNI